MSKKTIKKQSFSKHFASSKQKTIKKQSFSKPVSSKKKQILVVDDNEDIRTLVRTLLEGEGYKVAEAKGGEETLKTLKKKKFDLVLIDFFMAGMSGRELAERIRQDPKIKNTKFAFLTVAEFTKSGKKELKKLGSLDYIKKLVDNEDFKKRVKKIV